MVRKCVGVIVLLLCQCKGESRTKPVDLTATIRREHYCRVDSENAALMIQFDVRIRNQDNKTVFVPRSPYPLVLVSRSLRHAKEHRYEFELHAPDVFGVSPSGEADQQDTNEAIAPGRALETTTMDVTVPVPATERYNPEEILSPGVHYVQLAIEADDASGTPIHRLISQPMRIVVKQYREGEHCGPAATGK